MAIAATVCMAQATAPMPIGTLSGFEDLTVGDKFDRSVAGYTDWSAPGTEGVVEDTEIKAYETVGANGANYLKLDGVQNLAKKIDNDDTDEIDGTEIGEGLYIDTMVQFTASEEAPTPGDEDKLVVWLRGTEGENGGPTTYTLMVTAGRIDTENGEIVKQDYETDANVLPDTWYNLKVKAIANVDAQGLIVADEGAAGFVVFIDGVAAKTVTLPAIGEGAEEAFDSKYIDVENEEYALFPSLIDNATSSTISQLVFSGSGAIDTVAAFQGDCDPDAPTPTEDWVDPDDEEAMAKITGKTVAQAYPTLATSLSANLLAADAVKLTTWATGVGDVDFDDAAGINETAFLLGVANDETDLTLEPASIEIVNGKVVISANKELEDVNGKVYVKTAEDLEDLASAIWAEATLDGDGAVSLDAVEDASFYKIKVDF